ncbi:MAG: CBS domain-containing protein [Candidatus Aenigmarchaeota archaeon]|nr:CBS domain-containing protein [Candidatus Aenigmarchaeota archaeon]
MLVKEAMSRTVLTVVPEADLREAAALMVDNHVGCLVVAKKGKLEGIITERDIIKYFAEGGNVQGASVSDAMTGYVITVSPNAKIRAAVNLMNQYGIKKLIVTEGDTIAGIITSTDVVREDPRRCRDIAVLRRDKNKG